MKNNIAKLDKVRSFLDSEAEKMVSNNEDRDEIQDEAQEWIPDLSGEIDYLIPFPGIAQDIQSWILETSVKPQPALALASTLATLSCAIGRNINVDGIKGNVLLLCLAESGEGKDWPLKVPERILESVKMNTHVYGQMASGAALIDTICESPSALLMLDEIGHYFANITGKSSNQYSKEIMPIITELYTSASDKYREKKRKGMDARIVKEPNLSLVGFSTERQIMDALRTSEVADGSLARFFILFGSDNIEINLKRNRCKDVPDNIAYSLKELTERYNKPIFLSSTEINISDEYQELKDSIELRLNHQAMNLKQNNHLFKPFYHRLAVRAIQMSLLIDQCQSLDVLKWCCELIEKSTDVFIKKFSHMASDNENERYVKIVERAIKESGKKGISKSQLYDRTRQVNSTMKKAIIQDMMDSDKIFMRLQRINNSERASHIYYWKK